MWIAEKAIAFTYPAPIRSRLRPLRDVAQVSAHVEGERGAGGTREDAGEADRLGDELLGDARDREHGNRKSKWDCVRFRTRSYVDNTEIGVRDASAMTMSEEGV